MKRPPRFIAGAVCPSCGAVDRTVVEVVVEEAGATRVRGCVACGFSERETQSAPAVPGGRLDGAKSARARPDATPASTRAVRWVDPPPRPTDRKSSERSD